MSVDLAGLQAEHLRGHGPSGLCGGLGRCPSAAYLVIIEQQGQDLAESERSRLSYMEQSKGQFERLTEEVRSWKQAADHANDTLGDTAADYEAELAETKVSHDAKAWGLAQSIETNAQLRAELAAARPVVEAAKDWAEWISASVPWPEVLPEKTKALWSLALAAAQATEGE